MDLSFDPYFNPYPSRRTVQYAARGMVCAAHSLAAQAGLQTLRKGGDAADAALATAAAPTLPSPHGKRRACILASWRAVA